MPAYADDGTVVPTPTASATPQPTPRPTLTLTPSPLPAPTAVERPTSVPEPTHATRKRRRHLHPTPTASPTATHHRHKRKRRHKKARPTPTATSRPTKTPLPPLNLQAEDSVTPVTCNGAKKPDAAVPFLTAPYRGWTSIVSYVDHDLPNYERDGEIVTAAGATAVPNPLYTTGDFPAYWSTALRQFVYYDGHNGYDFNLWYQPVYAAAPGRVIFAAYEYPDLPDHGYGKMVMIDHHNGYVTLYGHFSRFFVHKGEHVKRGQMIGISGNTGHSSGPHLHFTVFHNCTPTDPYGWTGTGQDPLAAYQGEVSSYLWRQAPLVANPLRNWPGANTMPAGSSTRIALLRLPATTRGTKSFTHALQAEAKKAAAVLRSRGLLVRIDLLRAALVIGGTATANTIYRAPGVVSITTPDTEEGDRGDVLHALAQAARLTPHARVPVGRSSSWRGYIITWQHRTFLVGNGVKGGDVDLRLDEPGKGTRVHHLHADPQTGAFAVDLGPMSRTQAVALSRELEGRGTGGPTITPHVAVRARIRHSTRSAGVQRGYGWLGLIALIVAAAAAFSWYGGRVWIVRGSRSDG